MKNQNNSEFYSHIKKFLIGVLVISVLLFIASAIFSCSLTDAPTPKDWKEWWQNDPEVVDTVPQDTIPQPIEVDTPCTPIEYDQPLFVSGWWYIPFDITSDQIQVCAGGFCDTVPTGSDVTDALLSVLSQYDNTLNYQVYLSDPQTVVFIAKGTNERSKFQGKVWIRPISVHSGWGFDCNTQALFFFDALSFDEYITAIDSLPSFDKFTLQYTEWDSLQYIEAFDKILECRIGKSYADLRYLPFTFPDSVYQKFEAAGWDTVLY